MTSRFKALFLIVVLFVPGALAEGFTGKCDIEFFATSRLHDFSGKVQSEPIEATLVGAPNDAKTVASASVKVSVAKIHTHKKGIDKNMYKMFDAKKHPVIEGTMTKIRPYAVLQKMKAAGAKDCQVPIDLKIRDVTKTLTAKVRPLKEDEKVLTVSKEFDVSLAAYSLKPASLMGLLKVGDKVKVKVAVQITKPGPELLIKDYIVSKAKPLDTDSKAP